MAFPHKTADFPHLAAVVPLPARTATTGAAGADARAERRRRGPWRSAPGRTPDGRPAAPAEWRPRRAPGAPARVARRARPVPDPKARAVRGPRRGGPLAPRAQRRFDPRGGRDRVPRRPRGAPPAPRRRRRRRRRPRPLPARDVPPDRPGHRAAPVHPVRPQPGAQRRDRRDAHGLRPELRLAVRARPRQRPALRHDRGLPQLREAGLRLALPPPLGRDGLRAGRRAGQQAPPRHGLFPHPLQRQAVHGLRHRPGTGARHGRDGAPHVRRGLPRGPHGDPLADQRQLAAGLGFGDAGRRARLRGGQPGDAPDAVHPGRRDGPGHRGRCLRPDPRRGARRDDLRPAGPAGGAGRARARSPRRCRCSRARRRSGPRNRRSCCT